MLDPYKRLLAYFDEQAGVDGGAHNATPVLYRRACSDAAAPEVMRQPVYVTMLHLHGDESGHPSVSVHVEDTHVEWFALDLGLLGIHRITIERAYHEDDARAIDAYLSAAGL